MTQRAVLRVGAILLLLAFAGFAQRGRFGGSAEEEDTPPHFDKDAEFHFIRSGIHRPAGLPQLRIQKRVSERQGVGLVGPGLAGRRESLHHRHPAPDQNQCRRAPASGADRPELFEYPWIYVTQAANWDLSDAEVKQLREYLLRGGFLVTDDFWGPAEWEYFQETMQRVLPGHADHGHPGKGFGDARPL